MNKYLIKELMNVNRGSSPRPIIEYLSDSGYRWLKISDFNMYDRYVYETKEFIKESGLKNTRHLPAGTLILTNSATPGIPIFLGRDMCLHDGFLYFTNIKEDIINTNFLYYWFLYNRNLIVNQANGSVFKNLKKDIVENIEINVPSMDTQLKIVNVLDNINSKIELNNAINNNLYELMKIKFNDYIENLDEYEESVLSKIANYKNGLAMQNYRPVNENGLPVIKIKEINSGITSETERCSSDIDEEVIINDGDVLFAWSGTLCMSIWCGGKAGLNQHIFKVTSNKYPKWFYYFWTLKHLDNFIEIAAGKATTMGHIKRTELDKALVRIPSEKSINEMNNIFEPMLNKYINTNIENRNLSMLRDTLLPKLMNGKIDLDNIEV